MVIDSIEISNFKSYKGYHKIGPFKQFTCIIGPNGSGKSNLMEAIIFVLGYKSSTIRGKDLSELVFSGLSLDTIDKTTSSTGKPDKTDEESYVRMNYIHKESNKEYTFMRKIQGGATVYSVNYNQMSYQEYETKLEELDVHIECKNFFVFQGDVISLASQNPKQISALIEQVSGSGKLKYEYDELLKQKTAAEDDIMLTYAKKKNTSAEKQQLLAQYSEAKEFRNQLKKRDEIAVKSVLLKLHFLRVQIRSLTNVLGNKQKELEAVARDEEVKTNEQKNASKKQSELHKEHMTMEMELEKLERGKDKKKPDQFKIGEEIRMLADRVKKIDQLIEKAEKNHTLQLENIDQLRKELLETQMVFEDLERKEVKGKSIEMDKKQIEQYNEIKFQASKNTSELKKQLDQLKRLQNGETETLLTLSSRKDDLEKMKQQFQTSNTQLKERRDRATESIKEGEIKANELKEELKVQTAKNNQLNVKQVALTNELEKVQFILSEEKNQRSEKERDKNLMAAINTMKQLYPGVHGKLVDLCEPAQRKYSTALAVSMGKLMDAIVVDSESTAYECLNYLKEKLVGVCTFLPLDKLQAKPVNPKLRQLGGTSRLLIDCLKFDRSLEVAVRYVIGNIVVCDTLPEARQLAFGTDRQKVVTVAGIKITKSGLMSGGLMGMKNKVAQWDAAHIEKVKQQREGILLELAEVERSLVSFYDIQNMSLLLNELQTANSANQAMLIPINERIEKNNKEIKVIEKEESTLNPKIVELSKSIESRQEEIDEIKGKINGEEEKLFVDFCQELGISSIKEFEEDRLNRLQQLAQEKMTVAQKISKIQNQIDYENSRNLEKEIQDLKSDLEANQLTLEKELEIQEGSKKEDSKQNEQMEALTNEIKKSKNALFEYNTTIKELKKKISEISFKKISLENQIMIGLTDMTKYKKEYYTTLLEAKTENMRIPISTGMEIEEEEVDEELEKKKKKKSQKTDSDEEMGEQEEEEKEESDDESDDDGEKKKQKKKKTPIKSPKKTPKSPMKTPKKTPISPSKKKRKAGEEEREAEEEELDPEEKEKKLEEERRKNIFQDSDDEDLDSDKEEQENEDETNPFLELVSMPNTNLGTEEMEDFYDEHMTIPIDFKLVLDYDIRNNDQLESQLTAFSQEIHRIKTAMDLYNPNLKAFEQLNTITSKLRELSKELEEKRQNARKILTKFSEVSSERTTLFNKAFNSISKKINHIYGSLTKDLYPPYLKGSAQLTVEDTTQPFNGGVKYSAIPPNKRFQDMDQLSGGEKSIAALALLFAMHRYRPTPFFVLDEVDAAFDNINVLKLLRYIRDKTQKKKLQFVVISLKEIFFSNSDGLVGVCRDTDSTSQTLTCDLEGLPVKEVELLPIKEQEKFDKNVLSARKLKRESLLPEFLLTTTGTSGTETSDTGGESD